MAASQAGAVGDAEDSIGGISEYVYNLLHGFDLEKAKDLEKHVVAAEHEDIPPVDGDLDQRTTPPIVPREDKCPERLRSLLPPANFGAVVPGSIYRSSFPQPENFGFLESLKLKTILTLVPEPYPKENVEFIEKNGIRQFQVHIRANKGEVSITQDTMRDALKIILDRANHPILIHCNKGKHRTGCVVGCFRKCQGEPLEGILQEYHTYADPKARILDEIFIKFFDERSLLWMARMHNWRIANPAATDTSMSNVFSTLRVAPTPS